MEFQPLAFEPNFKEKIWGGEALLRHLNKPMRSGSRVGESWELSEHKNGPSIIRTGAWKGRKLSDVVKQYPEEILGSRIANRYGCVPLLVKFIDANDRLSIQVHPDDAYARREENDFGKTEAWHVVHAEPGARMICGLKRPLTPEEVMTGLETNSLEKELNEFAVKTGDTVFVPAGTVHAIEAGTIIYEVQEVSDVTYRLYDWGRLGDDGKPRDLHVESSLKVMNYNDTADHRTTPVTITGRGFTREVLAACGYFSLEKITVDKVIDRNMKGSFESITCLSGSGQIAFGKSRMAIEKGETLLLPAALKRWEARPDNNQLSFLLTYVPESAGTLIGELQASGVHYNDIAKLGGLI